MVKLLVLLADQLLLYWGIVIQEEVHKEKL